MPVGGLCPRGGLRPGRHVVPTDDAVSSAGLGEVQGGVSAADKVGDGTGLVINRGNSDADGEASAIGQPGFELGNAAPNSFRELRHVVFGKAGNHDTELLAAIAANQVRFAAAALEGVDQ